MANIKVHNLINTELNLFSNSDNSFQDLSDKEMNIQGGLIPQLIVAVILATYSSPAE
jgi:hypothetical protein